MSRLAQVETARAARPTVALSAGLSEWAPLGAIVATFIAISTLYNVRVPVYEAPDEIAHARYVRSIADEGELPQFSSPVEFESWQPPLYYALGAAVIKVSGLESPPELQWNPSFPGHAQNFLHTSDEDFPYTEPVLAVHVLRGISTLFGAGTVVFVYLTAVLIFPGRRLLSVTAAATASLVPQFAFISATLSNDPSSYFFAAGTVYFGLRHLRDGGWAWLLLTALAMSLGALSKLSALTVGVVPVAAILLQSKPWRGKVTELAVLALCPLAFAGWFYVRSLILWGAIFPDHLSVPLNPLPIWDPAYRRVFLDILRETFWYSGGPANIRLSPIVYDLLDVTSVLAVAGLVVTIASSRLARFEKRGVFMLSALPVLALGGLLYYSVQYDFQPQGRYLFVAMPAFAILMPLGLGAVFSRDRERDHPAMLVLPVLLLAVNISIFAITLPRYY